MSAGDERCVSVVGVVLVSGLEFYDLKNEKM